MKEDKAKEEIKSIARNIGFDIIGFTDASTFKSDVFKDRQEKGYLSGLEETDINKRIDPKLSLKNVQTIISLGICYNCGFEYKYDKDTAFISKCAYGMDYHLVFKTMLNKLTDQITDIYKVRCISMCDTGPLPDRLVAVRAGIGAYGKNCSVINKDYGSWIFLGEVLTELKITPDKSNENEDICGDCNKCIKACPTGALVEPYVLNAKLCLSYNTVKRGIIPDNVKVKFGNRIYGCDTCQLVCPKNKGVKISDKKEFMPQNQLLKLDQILNLNNNEFNKIFGNTSAAWRGKNVLKRNAIIAMGNSKNKEYLGILKEYINDEKEMFKESANWAIKRLVEDKYE